MMKILAALIVTYSFAGANAFAAIPCGPGMGGGCPTSPPSGPRLPGENPPIYREPSKVLVIGYFEVPSPNCDVADLPQAQEGAKEAALAEAQSRLRTNHVVQVTEFRLNEQCDESIYANSYRGKSWIVLAFAHYSVQ